MPHSTHFSSHPEMFQAAASQRNLHTIQASPQQSLPLQQKQQCLSKPNVGQIFLLKGSNSLPHGASTNSLNPARIQPYPSGLEKIKRTSLHNLTFAAAIVAASLQLFTLPGLDVESQQNPTQLGSSSNAEIIYAQNNLRSLSEDKKANELNTLELLGAILSFIAIVISLLNLYLKEIPKIKTELVQAEKDRKQMEEDRKEMTEKLLEIVNILNR